jgi:replicative DNA helicase
MDNSSLIKQMPVSIEAEQALLGSIITNADAFDKVSGMISVDDFYLDEHKHIYASLLTMYMQSKKIDAVTLVNALVEAGDRDEAGGVQYISLLANSVPTVSNVKDYARIVKDKSTLRKLIGACDEITADAYSESGTVQQLVDNAEQKIFDISHNNESKDFRPINEILQNVYKDIEYLQETKGAIKGVRSGFSSLDEKIIQMGKGDLVILGARPGMGKTSFAMNVATNVAKSSGKAVAIFSLEMSGEQLVTRILSSEALVDSHSLRTGKLSTNDWEQLASVAETLAGCKIFIDDTSALTTTAMKSKLRRLSNLGLVVIDYIGLMESTAKTDNRAQQVGEISRNLKVMAKDLGVPILCCAQLNRATETRTGENKKPTLSDLRDSGSIEQDADIVLFLYREEYYKDISGNPSSSDGNDSSANTAEVIIAKNRHGSTGNIPVGWIGKFTKFRSLEDKRE